MTVESTFDAVKARLETTGLPVHDTAVVNERDELVVGTYLILFDTLPDDLEERYSRGVFVDGPVDWDLDVRLVGASKLALRKALDRLRVAVVGHRFVIPGRQCSPARLEAGTALLDRSIKPGLWVCDTGVLFTSRPGGS